MSSDAASEPAPGTAMGLMPGLSAWNSGILGDVERVVRERGVLLLHEELTGIRLGQELRQEQRGQFERLVLLAVRPVDVVGDGEPGHRHGGVDHGFAVAVGLRVAGEGRLRPAGRDQIARLGLPGLHVLDREGVLGVEAEAGVPLAGGLDHHLGAVDVDDLVGVEPETAHALGGGANVSGTVIRLRQFDALHHRLPVTARAAPSSTSPCWRWSRARSCRWTRSWRRRIDGGPEGRSGGRRVAADPHDRHRHQGAGDALGAPERRVLLRSEHVEIGAALTIGPGDAERLVAGERAATDVARLGGLPGASGVPAG